MLNAMPGKTLGFTRGGQKCAGQLTPKAFAS